MSIDPTIAKIVAQRLECAELERNPIGKVTSEFLDIGISEAYEIQRNLRAAKSEKGHEIIGYKAALTSREKMHQMGLNTPVYGFLAEYHDVSRSRQISMSELIHPKIEPEIAFILKRDLRGPGCHVASVLAATDYISAAIEIVDSRYINYEFDLPSVIADNCSSGRFVLGNEKLSPYGLDLRCLGVVLAINGDVVATAAGAAVLGHPASSVAMVANLLADNNEFIPAGSIVLTGGMTKAISLQSGDFIEMSMLGGAMVSAAIQK